MRSRLQRESPLDLLLHTALDAVIVMSADGKIAEWNDCATDMFGWARDEALGRCARIGRRAHGRDDRHAVGAGGDHLADIGVGDAADPYEGNTDLAAKFPQQIGADELELGLAARREHRGSADR